MKTAISLDELRKNLTDVAGKVMYGNDTIFVKKYNRTGMVLLSQQEYEYLKDPRKRLSKTRWKNKFKTIDKIREAIPVVDPEIIEKAVTQAVKEVRTERKLQ